MRTGGSKQKGSSFEREVAKNLSKWISNGERDDLIWRSAMSGGRATLQIKKGQTNLSQVGDLSAIDRAAHSFLDKFVCECKHYKSLDILAGMIHSRGNLFQFWDRLCKDSIHVKKLPMLIARQNRVPTLVLVSPIGTNLLSITRGRLATFHSPQWMSCDVYLFNALLKSKYPFKED